MAKKTRIALCALCLVLSACLGAGVVYFGLGSPGLEEALRDIERGKRDNAVLAKELEKQGAANSADRSANERETSRLAEERDGLERREANDRAERNRLSAEREDLERSRSLAKDDESSLGRLELVFSEGLEIARKHLP